MRRFHRSLPSVALLAALVGGGVADASAQRAKPSVGLIAGFNLARLGGSGPDSSNQSRLTDLIAGVGMSVPITPTIAFAPELIYTRKGTKVNVSEIDGSIPITTAATMKFSYVELPLLAKVSLPTVGRALVPHFVVGPAIAVRLGCRMDVTASAGGLSQSVSADCADDSGQAVRKTDLGIVVGAGLSYSKLSVNARYERGLRSIGAVDGSQSITNRVLTFTVGVDLGRFR